jgi:hypothetical protein
MLKRIHLGEDELDVIETALEEKLEELDPDTDDSWFTAKHALEHIRDQR